MLPPPPQVVVVSQLPDMYVKLRKVRWLWWRVGAHAASPTTPLSPLCLASVAQKTNVYALQVVVGTDSTCCPLPLGILTAAY